MKNSNGHGYRHGVAKAYVTERAWHDDSTDALLGTPVYTNPIVAFTNLPYMPDGGRNCGAGLVNTPGSLDGLSIVAGHEYAETLTDQFPEASPPGGWTITVGGHPQENGDLCAWVGLFDLTLATGTFAMQPTWSNAAGSCAASGPIIPNAPGVTSVSPSTIPTIGGASVTVTGAWFTGATALTVGGTSVPFTVIDQSHLRFSAPAKPATWFDVIVTTPNGTSATNVGDRLMYTDVYSPTVVMRGSSVEDMFLRGGDAMLYWKWHNVANNTSGAWTPLGAFAVGQPQVIARVLPGGGHVDDVYVRSLFGIIVETSVNVDAGTWTTLRAIGAATLSDPTVVTSAARLPIEDVYVQVSNGTLFSTSLDVSSPTSVGGPWIALGFAATGRPAVVPRAAYGNPTDTTDDVYVRGGYGLVFVNTVDHVQHTRGTWQYTSSGATLTDPVVVTSPTRFPVEDVYSEAYVGGELQSLAVNTSANPVTSVLLGNLGATFGSPAVVARANFGGPNVDDVIFRGFYAALFRVQVDHVNNTAGGLTYLFSGPMATDPTVVTGAGRFPFEDMFARSIQGDLSWNWTNPSALPPNTLGSWTSL